VKFLSAIALILFLVGCSSDQKQILIDASVSNEDTLVFYKESDKNQHQLKVVTISDSTIWYSLNFKNQTGNKSIEGDGVDIYYNLDPEIDEINGEAQPVLEFESTNPIKGLIIRIDMMEHNFAKVLTSTDYEFKEIPSDEVLIKR